MATCRGLATVADMAATVPRRATAERAPAMVVVRGPATGAVDTIAPRAAVGTPTVVAAAIPAAVAGIQAEVVDTPVVADMAAITRRLETS